MAKQAEICEMPCGSKFLEAFMRCVCLCVCAHTHMGHLCLYVYMQYLSNIYLHFSRI